MDDDLKAAVADMVSSLDRDGTLAAIQGRLEAARTHAERAEVLTMVHYELKDRCGGISRYSTPVVFEQLGVSPHWREALDV